MGSGVVGSCEFSNKTKSLTFLFVHIQHTGVQVHSFKHSFIYISGATYVRHTYILFLSIHATCRN